MTNAFSNKSPCIAVVETGEQESGGKCGQSKGVWENGRGGQADANRSKRCRRRDLTARRWINKYGWLGAVQIDVYKYRYTNTRLQTQIQLCVDMCVLSNKNARLSMSKNLTHNGIRKVNKQLNCLVPNKINECQLSLRVCLFTRYVWIHQTAAQIPSLSFCQSDCLSVSLSDCCVCVFVCDYILRYTRLAQIQFEQSERFANTKSKQLIYILTS